MTTTERLLATGSDLLTQRQNLHLLRGGDFLTGLTERLRGEEERRRRLMRGNGERRRGDGLRRPYLRGERRLGDRERRRGE